MTNIVPDEIMADGPLVFLRLSEVMAGYDYLTPDSSGNGYRAEIYDDYGTLVGPEFVPDDGGEGDDVAFRVGSGKIHLFQRYYSPYGWLWHNDLTTTGTIEVVITPDAVGGRQQILWHSNYEFAILDNGALEFAYYYEKTGGGLVRKEVASGAGVVRAGGKQHLAVTFSHAESKVVFYRDGAPVATVPTGGTGPIWTGAPSSAHWFADARPAPPVSQMNGVAHEVMVYSTTLTKDRMSSHVVLPPLPVQGPHHGNRMVEFTAGPWPPEETLPGGAPGTATPGDVTRWDYGTTNPDNTPEVTGSTTPWGDGNDTTLVKLTTVSTVPTDENLRREDRVHAPVSTPSGATFAGVRVRASATTSRTGDPSAVPPVPPEHARLGLAINAGGVTYTLTRSVGGGEIVSDGAIADYVFDTVSGGTVAGMMAALANGGTVSARVLPSTTSGNHTFTASLYEVMLDYTVGAQTVQPLPPRTALEVLGPSEPEHGVGGPDIHHGMFAIPMTREISFMGVVGWPTGPVWVTPYARFFSWDGTAGILKGEIALSAPRLLERGMDWSEYVVHSAVPDEFGAASHWTLVFEFASEDPRVTPSGQAYAYPVPPDTKIRVDCAYVTDNGLDLIEHEQPYLDGDQPGGRWDGVEHRSTSTWGPRPRNTLSDTIVIDDEITIH